jgi:cytochrome c biogenesis protein CcdA
MGAYHREMMRIINQAFLRRKLLQICCLVLLWVNIPWANADNGKVKILFFYTRTCPECQFIKDEFLPKIIGKYQHQLESKSFEITSVENFELLIDLEKSFGRKINKTPPLMIVGDDVLEGESAIQTMLKQTINKHLKSGGTEWPKFALKFNQDGNVPIIEKFRELTPLVIIGCGLLDGINPCAFATLIFLISYLTMLGRKGKELLFSGINFTIGVFIAYFLVGYGLLELLNRFSAFGVIGNLLTYIMAGILGLLCILSFYDYILVKQGKPNKFKLQLNKYLKQKIHATIRKQTRSSFFLITSFILGLIVALYEFPCTGQIYLPIVFVLKGISVLKLTAILYLALYNLMFILPLIIVFSFVYWGATSNRIAQIMQKHIGSIKLLSALLFGLLAVLLVFLH